LSGVKLLGDYLIINHNNNILDMMKYSFQIQD